MTLRVRPTRSPEEFEAATGVIDHYLGGAWTSEDAERFGLFLPADRLYAALDGDAIVGGAGAFPVELSIPGGQVSCAGVTVVGVLPTHRRRGLLGRMMRAQLADIRERGEPVSVSWASEETIYGRFGYGLAAQDAMIGHRVDAALRVELPGRTGTTRLVGHDEAARTFPRIYDRVLSTVAGFRFPNGDLVELRQLDDRPESRRGSGELNRVLLEIGGRSAGYALYRIKLDFEEATNKSRVQVLEAIGDSPTATRELWRYLLAIDWVDEIHCDLLSPDHPLFLLVQRPNRLNWKDLRRALAAPRGCGRCSGSPR